MTLRIGTMKDKVTAAAVKAGGVCKCPECDGHGYIGSTALSRLIMALPGEPCSACRVTGSIRYHYVGRAMPRQGVKASPLGNPYKVGGKGILACPSRGHCLHQFEVMIRTNAKHGGTDLERQREAALSAIVADFEAGYRVILACWCAKAEREPYDNPAEHADGCHADVIAKLVMERVKP